MTEILVQDDENGVKKVVDTEFSSDHLKETDTYHHVVADQKHGVFVTMTFHGPGDFFDKRSKPWNDAAFLEAHVVDTRDGKLLESMTFFSRSVSFDQYDAVDEENYEKLVLNEANDFVAYIKEKWPHLIYDNDDLLYGNSDLFFPLIESARADGLTITP